MNNITVIILGVIVHEGKILLTKRVDKKEKSKNGIWQIPGGGLEFGEHPEDGIIRELKEELGVNVKVIKVLPFIDNRFIKNNHNSITWHGLRLFFLCKPESFNFTLNHEASEWKWFSKEEIKTFNHFGKIVEIFEFV